MINALSKIPVVGRAAETRENPMTVETPTTMASVASCFAYGLITTLPSEKNLALIEPRPSCAVNNLADCVWLDPIFFC